VAYFGIPTTGVSQGGAASWDTGYVRSKGGCKFSQGIGLEAISRAVPRERIEAVLEAEGVREVRERKLVRQRDFGDGA
jgi:hypothetical protein